MNSGQLQAPCQGSQTAGPQTAGLGFSQGFTWKSRPMGEDGRCPRACAFCSRSRGCCSLCVRLFSCMCACACAMKMLLMRRGKRTRKVRAACSIHMGAQFWPVSVAALHPPLSVCPSVPLSSFPWLIASMQVLIAWHGSCYEVECQGGQSVGTSQQTSSPRWPWTSSSSPPPSPDLQGPVLPAISAFFSLTHTQIPS